MHEAGVGVLAGTDCGNPYCFPGFGSHDDLELLVDAGLTPLQVVQAATRDAARYLGLERTSGTVTQHKWADLLVLDANPLADIANTRKIHAVVARGRVISAAERQQILDRVEREAKTAPVSKGVTCCGVGRAG